MGTIDNHHLHAAVFAFPFSTHAAPLLTIIRRLAKSAPNVLFSFFNISQSNTSLFSTTASSDHHSNDGDHILPNIRPHNVWDGVPNGYVFKGKPQEDIELFMETAPKTLRKEVAVAEAETGRKVSCMIGDGFLWFVADMAEEIGVPWVACWTAGDHSLSIHAYTDVIRDKIGIQDAEQYKDEPLSFISGMSEIRVQDLPDGIVSGRLHSIFSKMLHQMGKSLPRAIAVASNSFEELNPVVTNDLRSKFQALLPIGPLNLLLPPQHSHKDPYHSLLWLDQQTPNSVAYVSFGSVAKPSPSEIVALAEALEASGVKFLWSIRDDEQKAIFLNGFLERNREHGIVVPWVPQVEVLRHEATGVFVTHFGWNSVIESITAEVPMIGRPLIGEQKLNGRFVEAVWEIGVAVRGGVFTKEGVTKDLKRVLFNEDGENMRKNLRYLREQTEKAIGPEGSSISNLQALTEIIMMPHG